MRLPIAAALALIASPLEAQTVATPAVPDLSTATPIAGKWNYAAMPDGSEAVFANSAAQPQLILRCSRATRQVSIAVPATGATPFLSLWTSSQTRALPAGFNPAIMRLTATVSAYDPLLDAIAFSRGRLGLVVNGRPPLVVPAWAEIARVVEDCRE